MKIPTRKRLLALAGARVFERGEQYFAWGRVRSLTASEGSIHAIVDGNQSYQVSIQGMNGRVRHECTCPMGRSGKFCKHGVAVCLAAMHQETRPESAPLLNLVGCIEGLPHEELVEIALDEAMRNVRLRERFRLRAARKAGSTAWIDEYRRILRAGAERSDSAETEAGEESARDEVASSLSLLLEEGWAETVVMLTEETLIWIAGECSRPGSLRDLSEMLCEYHHEGCRRQGIPSADLAARLIHWQMHCVAQRADDPLGDVEDRYADLLGEDGTRAYRGLLAQEWRKVCEGAGKDTPEARAKFGRVAVLMTRSAERHHDLETLISVKSHRLDTADAFLDVARLCKIQGRRDLSLEWALLGKRRFPAPEAGDLYDFLSAEYEERTEWEQALAVLFESFAAQPSLAGYQKMMGLALRTGAGETWRDRALEAVRKASERPLFAYPRRSSKAAKPDQSLLVSILLWEKEDEAAWRAAQEGECEEELWLSLADLRADKHPEDALLVYRRVVLRNINRKNQYAYRRAIELVQRIGRIMRKQKGRDEFITYLEQLRQTHRAQHSFAKLVDRMLARYYAPHR